MILYQKLYDIDKNGRQTISKSLKPVFKFKKNTREDYVKNEIKSLAQENLFILKKLLSKNSEYSTHKMEKQYQQSQKYKRNICHYPSIDFYTSKNNNAPIVQGYNFNVDKKAKTEEYNSKQLPKIGGVTIKSSLGPFRLTHGTLDERFYKEAQRSSRMNSTTKSKFKNTRYNNDKKNKEASNIEEASNEGSSSGKNDSGDESENRSGSGDGSGEGSGSGSGSGDGSGSGSGDGSGSGSGGD